MLKNYFIVEQGQQSGPFTFEELKSKKLKKTTMVWTEGMTEWSSAESISELRDLLIVEPPPPPAWTSPPPYNAPQPQTASPQHTFVFDKDFLSGPGGMLIGTIGIILFSLLSWVNISVLGYRLKFNLFSLANELNSGFFRELLSGSEEIMLVRIVVIVLLIALVLSFAFLIIALLKPQLKSRQALAYSGFGLCAIVTGIFILAMIYISLELEHWIMTAFPFLTLGAAIVSMIFFVKRPAKIDLSSMARELKGVELQIADNEPQINTKKRNDFVTIWLWLLIVANCITLIFSKSLPYFTWISLLLSLLNIGFVYLLFKGKKNGFWGLCATAIIGMFFSVSSYPYHSMVFILSAGFGIGINYAIFQLKNNGVSFWSQLEKTNIGDDIKEITEKSQK